MDQSPHAAIAGAIASVVGQRGTQYSPDSNQRYRQLIMSDRIAKAVVESWGSDLPDGALAAIQNIAVKLSRAIESAMDGRTHIDCVLDIGGYLALLAGLRMGKPPDETFQLPEANI